MKCTSTASCKKVPQSRGVHRLHLWKLLNNLSAGQAFLRRLWSVSQQTSGVIYLSIYLGRSAGATQPILPRLPQLTSLHRCHLPYCPYHRVASIRQPRGNSRCQSELHHNHSPLIPIASTLTCLPYIHPPIIQGSLYSIHPPKSRSPSSTSPVNFCIHYLF